MKNLLWNSTHIKREYQIKEKEVAVAASLCYYLPHEDKCKRGKNTMGCKGLGSLEEGCFKI